MNIRNVALEAAGQLGQRLGTQVVVANLDLSEATDEGTPLPPVRELR